MKAIIIAIIIFVLLSLGLVGVGFWGYNNGWFDNFLKKDQKSLPELKKMTNYSIKIFDYETKNSIETNFSLFWLEKIYSCLDKKQFELIKKNSTRFNELFPAIDITVSDLNVSGCYIKKINYIMVQKGLFLNGYNQLGIEVNKTYSLFAYSEDHYPAQLMFFVNDKENQRNEYELWQEPEVNLSPNFYDFQDDKIHNVELNISVKHILDKFLLCTSWSFGFTYVKPEGYLVELSAPKRLPAVDSCYLFTNQLINANKTVKLNIKTNKLAYNDFLQIYVVDFARYYNDIEWVEDFEDHNGADIGAADIIKTFKSQKT